MPDRQREERVILSELRRIETKITKRNEELAALYDRRMELWQDARAMEPPMRLASIGDASGVKEPAVINALKKRRERDEANA